MVDDDYNFIGIVLVIAMAVAFVSGAVIGSDWVDRRNDKDIDLCEQELNAGLHANLKWKKCELIAVPKGEG